MAMTKADIVGRIHQEANFSKKDATDLVELIFETIKDTLAKGEKVKISGFGNFVIKDKRARRGRNPQTKEAMEIAGRRVLTFRPSQVLKDDLTAKYAHRLNAAGDEDTSLPPKEGKSKALSNFFNNIEDDDHQSE